MGINVQCGMENTSHTSKCIINLKIIEGSNTIRYGKHFAYIKMYNKSQNKRRIKHKMDINIRKKSNACLLHHIEKKTFYVDIPQMKAMSVQRTAIDHQSLLEMQSMSQITKLLY